jgi:Fic family protein
MSRFEEAYDTRRLSKIQQVIAVAAAHHRLTWIHPFLDGNGRVARLTSHAWFRRLSIGDSLWSVARGLAKQKTRYKALLMAADESRRSDLDGRGSLSHAGLVEFCEFFLGTCIDQVKFMDGLLETSTMVERIERYVAEASRRGEIPLRTFALLRETLLMGAVERGKAASLLGVTDRQARTIVNVLVERGLLTTKGPRAALNLGFPTSAVDSWFPKLYPETTGL